MITILQYYFKKKEKLIFLIIFSFFSSHLLSQNSFDSLAKAFDNFEYSKIKNLIEISEKEIDSYNEVQINLFYLIKFWNQKEWKNNQEREKHLQSIFFLLNNNLKNFSPFFINDYVLKALSNSLNPTDEVSELLKFGLSISEKKLNQSHILSVSNHMEGLLYQRIIEKDSKEKARLALKRLEFYKNNMSELSYLNKNEVYRMHEDLLRLNVEPGYIIERNIIKNSFKEILKKNVNFKRKETLDSILYFYLYKLYKEGDFEFLNFLSQALYEGKFKLHNLIAEYFLDPNAKKTKSIINYVKSINSKLNTWEEQLVGKVLYDLIEISVYNDGIPESTINIKKQPNINVLDEIYTQFSDLFYYAERSNYSNKFFFWINMALNLLEKTYSGGLLYDDNFQNQNIFNDVKLKELQILEDKFKNSFSDITYGELIKLINYRIEKSYYNETNIDNELFNLIEKFSEFNNDKSLILLIDGIFQIFKNLRSIVAVDLIENYNTEIETFLNKIKKRFLKNTNSIEELKLRITFSSFLKSDFKKLEKEIDNLKSVGKISEVEHSNYILSLYHNSLYDLSNHKNQSKKFIELFINKTKNIDIYDFNYQDFLVTSLNFTIMYKFDEFVPKLSTLLLEVSEIFLENANNAIRYQFTNAAGNFYNYIGNYNDAYLFYLQSKANVYHYDRNFITNKTDVYKILDLLDKVTTIEIANNKLENFNQRVDEYLDEINTLTEISKLSKNVFNIDLEFINRKLALFKGSYYSKIGNYEMAVKILSKHINEFQIDKKNGFIATKKVLLGYEILSGIYEEEKIKSLVDEFYLDNNIKKDSWYFAMVNKRDSESIEFDLDDFIQTFEEKVKLINQLSFDNQIPLFKDFVTKFKLIERDVYNLNNSKNKVNYFNQLAEILLNIDNIDTYNSKVLNLSERNQETYFNLLDKRYKDVENFQNARSNFDAFQQSIKSELNSFVYLNIHDFIDNFDDEEVFLRISRTYSNNNKDFVYIVYMYNSKETKIIELEGADLERVYNYHVSQIKNGFTDNWSYDYFFEPISKKLPTGTKKIYIKNDAVFSNINFEALYNEYEDQFVFDKYDINYIEKPNAIFNNDILSLENAFLFGNPLFGSGTESSVLRTGLNQLPNTEIEINEINNLLSKNNIEVIKTNLNSSTEKSLYDNSKADIIHIATHGFFNENDTGFNFGLLASGAKETIKNDFQKIYRNDGIIFGNEIFFKNFTKSNLVVLSACETGVGDRNFLGSSSLTNSFLRAGAKNVISTLWEVDDLITKEFMIDFYYNLLKTKDIRSSLKTTKMKIKQKYKNPLYWAGFVLTQNLN